MTTGWLAKVVLIAVLFEWAADAAAIPPIGGTPGCEDAPGAVISGFVVSNGSAQWIATLEDDTALYRLEGRSGTSPWVSVATVGVGNSPYSVSVSGYDEYRLVELDLEGAPRYWGRSADIATRRARRTQRAEVVQSTAPSAGSASVRAYRTERQARGVGADEGIVLFVPDDTPFGGQISFFVERDLVPYLEDMEYTVYVENLSSYPDYTQVIQRRDAIKAAIASYHTTLDVRLFHLIGKSSDYWYLDGPFTAAYWPPEWESIRQDILYRTVDKAVPADLAYEDLIPTYVEAITEPPGRSAQSQRPYIFTDQPYADVVGNDGVPDVIVTRWPVRTMVDTDKMISKLLNYNNSSAWGVLTEATALYFSGNEPFENVGDNLGAEEVAARIAALIPSEIHQETLESASTPDIATRNDLAVALWNDPQNSYPTIELIVTTASVSGRYYPGGFFHKFFSPIEDTFDYTDIYSTEVAVVVAASCGAADFVSTNWWNPSNGDQYGDPTFMDLLVHATVGAQGKGAIAWVGPTGGTWQRANEPMAEALVSRLYESPYRPLAETWTLALTDVLEEYGDDERIKESARSFVFLGDPISRFNPRRNNPVGVAETSGLSVGIGLATPNPSRSTTRISYATARRVPVSVRVYDVSGRLVATLVDGEKDAGYHTVLWDGRNENGRMVAGGVYLCRIEAGEIVETRKVTRYR